MAIWALVSKSVMSVREFFFPTYRPERHYMRGPGPACARTRNFSRQFNAR